MIRAPQLCRSWQRFIAAALVMNLLIMIYLAIQQHTQMPGSSGSMSDHHTPRQGSPDGLQAEDFSKSVTVVLRDFEDFDNVLENTTKKLHKVLPGVKILIVGDTHPYPPLKMDKTVNVEVVSLQKNLLHNYSSGRPDHLITTKFVLLLPDGVELKHWKHIQKATNLLNSRGRTKAVAVGVGPQPLKCLSVDVDLKRWQVTYTSNSTTSDYCDMFEGDHAIFMYATDFRSLADPFARPLGHSYYLQAKVRQWKVRYLRRFQLVRFHELFKDPHKMWKHKRAEEKRLAEFYKSFGIKLAKSVNGLEKYYGCTKSTSRCFGTIVDDMPDYLYQGKWTPPCCLKALRETTAHVFGILESEGVRYWLEGGSLLGAARNQDIIPWDYDVDIGMYKEDINKSSYLRDASQRSFVDEQGFVWEKALEGDFFRVQYSEQNHLHVDIHPFYPQNGIMTKDTWFPTHRQDTEFPEHYLKPLTKIKFAGVMANAPNHIKQFLEYKFGAGVIENPRFPNFKKVS